MRLSFQVIRADKEILAFPVLAGVFSILYSAALLFPTIIIQIIRLSEKNAVQTLALSVADYLILGATYLGLAFIATFFNVCVVYTTKTRFQGGDATFMDSLRFACSKIHLVFAWALVSATVGMIFRAIDSVAERVGAIGSVVIKIFSAILGVVWSLATIFVVPAMVYHDVGPVEAVKRSASALKKTWGESLLQGFSFSLLTLFFFLLGGIVLFGVSVLVVPLGGIAVVIAIGFGVIYFLGVSLVINVAATVFHTALYSYATTGVAPGGFDEDVLSTAFAARA